LTERLAQVLPPESERRQRQGCPRAHPPARLPKSSH